MLQPGNSYRVVSPENLYYRQTVIIEKVIGGIGWGAVDGCHYPFLPAELEAVEPTPPKPKRPSPARRAAIYRELLEQIAKEWPRMPQHLRDELARALEL